MKNPLRTLGTEALYAQLGRIVESIPQLAVPRPNAPSVYLPLTREQLLWLGRAEALVERRLAARLDSNSEVRWQTSIDTPCILKEKFKDCCTVHWLRWKWSYLLRQATRSFPREMHLMH